MTKWSIRNVGEVLIEAKEKAEQYAASQVKIHGLLNFTSYGLAVIFLLKVSQLVLHWQF